MISQALSFSKTCSSSDISDTAVPAGAENGANSPFSAVLASLDAKADGSGEQTTAAAEAAVNGTALPVPAATGKILPDVAATAPADPSAPTADDGAEEKANSAETETAASGIPPLQLTLPAAVPSTIASAEAEPAPGSSSPPAAATPEATAGVSAALLPTSETLPLTTEADADRTGRRAGTQPPHALLASSTNAEESGPAPTEATAQVKRESGERAGSPTVALHVAPEASLRRSIRSDAGGGAEVQAPKVREAAPEGLLLPKTASGEVAPQPSSPTLAQGLHAENSQTSRPVESARPAFQSEALQDLTHIVDRLVAAREALTPAATSLALKHADFGELSLRFEQQRDGQLAVQLSASDPDAHRAITAAVNERGAATTAENNTAAGQSQAQQRGLGSERDSTGSNTANGNADRRDQSQQRRSGSDSPRGGPSAERSGIFA